MDAVKELEQTTKRWSVVANRLSRTIIWLTIFMVIVSGPWAYQFIRPMWAR